MRCFPLCRCGSGKLLSACHGGPKLSELVYRLGQQYNHPFRMYSPGAPCPCKQPAKTVCKTYAKCCMKR